MENFRSANAGNVYFLNFCFLVKFEIIISFKLLLNVFTSRVRLWLNRTFVKHKFHIRFFRFFDSLDFLFDASGCFDYTHCYSRFSTD